MPQLAHSSVAEHVTHVRPWLLSPVWQKRKEEKEGRGKEKNQKQLGLWHLSVAFIPITALYPCQCEHSFFLAQENAPYSKGACPISEQIRPFHFILVPPLCSLPASHTCLHRTLSL